MSTHCDLGSRYPWDSCPTRIDRKKGYQEPEKVKLVSKPIITPGNVAVYRLAKNNGILPHRLRSLAIRLFKGEDLSGGITPKKAELLLKKYLEGGIKQ